MCIGALVPGVLAQAKVPIPSLEDFQHQTKAPDREREEEVVSYADLVSGQSVYSIPLDLPAGTGGAQPGLALTYSSGSRAGHAGVGWSVGLPAIKRSIKHGAFAAYNDPHEIADYELSGEKLLRGDAVTAPAAIDCAGTTFGYVREISRFERVYHCDAADYFVVAKPNGTTWWYGSSPDAKQVTPSGQTLSYHLSKVVDRNGLEWHVNYWRYGDCNRDGVAEQGALCAPLPRTVAYTFDGSSAVGAERHVDFVWEDIPGGSPADLDLALVSYRRARLTRINVTVGGSTVRHYDLGYQTSSQTGASLLDSVEIFSGSGKADLWKKLEFDYSDGEYAFRDGPASPQEVSDGYLDSLSYRSGGALNGSTQTTSALGFRTLLTSTTNVTLPLEQQAGLGPIVIDRALDDVPSSYSLTDTAQDLFDIDGDGLKDLVQVSWSASCDGGGGCYRWYVRKGLGGAEFSASRDVVPGIRDVFIRRTVKRRVYTGDTPHAEPELLYEMADVNRDGLLDLFTRDGVFVNLGGSFELRPWSWNDPNGAPLFLSDGDYFNGQITTLSRLVDVDGDQCVDHLFVRTSPQVEWLVRHNRMCDSVPEEGFDPPVVLASPGVSLPPYLARSSSVLASNLADVNGDGLIDFIWDALWDDQKIDILLGTGSGFVPETRTGTTYAADLFPLTGGHIFRTQTAFPEAGYDPFPPIVGGPKSAGYTTKAALGGPVETRTMALVADFNGDGRPDVVRKKNWATTGSQEPDGPLEVFFNTGNGFAATPVIVPKPSSSLLAGLFFAPNVEHPLYGEPTYRTFTLAHTDRAGASLASELMVMSYAAAQYDAPPTIAVFRNTTRTPPDLLTTVRNGWGTTTEFEYEVHVQGMSSSASVPPTLPFRRTVLRKLSVHDEPTGTPEEYETDYTTYYGYGDGFYDDEFRGFGRVNVSHGDATGLSEERIEQHYFHVGTGQTICDPWSDFCVADQRAFAGRPYRVMTLGTDWSTDLSVQWMLFGLESFNFAGRVAAAPVLDRQIAYEAVVGDYDYPDQRMSHYEHDQYGNVVREHHLGWFDGNAGDIDPDAGDSSYSIYREYATPLDGNYLVDRPSRIETYTGDFVSRTVLAAVDLTYDNLPPRQARRGNLTGQDETVLSSTGAQTHTLTSFDVDGFGNVLGVTVDDDLLLSYDYQDPEEIYVSRETAHVALGKTQPVLLETHKTWNDALGVLDDEVDAAGRWLAYRYDAHGRLLETWSCPPEAACVSRAEATVLLSERQYDDSEGPRKVVSKTYYGSSAADRQVQVSYVDGLGRTVQSLSPVENGKWSRRTTQIGFHGQAAREQMPHFVAGDDYYPASVSGVALDPVTVHERSYDALRRVTGDWLEHESARYY